VLVLGVHAAGHSSASDVHVRKSLAGAAAMAAGTEPVSGELAVWCL
jgi:hypothetical protein